MREDVIEKIEKYKIISIIRNLSKDDLMNAVKALYDGGIRLVEVTFNQNDPSNFSKTCDMIKMIKENFDMCVGAGTVTSPELVDMAADAGAEYIVSPDTDPAVIKRTLERGLVSLPGAFTATEAKIAHNAGADFVKLFPCVNASILKAICAPLNNIRFLAVGGVDSENAESFLNAGAAGLGVGGCLVNKKWIAEGRFDLIKQEAEKFVAILNR